MTEGQYINAHKIFLIPFVIGLMYYYQNWSMEAFIYLSIHGTYCILWLVKHQLYPDKRFRKKQGFLIGLFFIFIPLAGYYIAPYLLISKKLTLPPYLIALFLFIYIIGIFLHYVSDAQKFYLLQNKKALITNGLFKRTRNPNYLGEILIYFAFAAMSMHWLPFIVLAFWVFGFFLRNMLKKDKSLSRYPGWKDYKKNSWLLFPKL